MLIDFWGDICLSNYKGNEQKLKKISADINVLLGRVDYRIVDLENPVIDGDEYDEITKAGPCLFMDKRYASFLEELDIDGFALANNHIGDYGPTGLKETVDLISAFNKDYCGVGYFEDEYVPIRIDGNIKVSIFSICENEFGTAELSLYGSNGYRIDKIKSAILTEKELADYIVVIFHGGAEYYPFPTPMQQQRYRLLCDFGASAVIGTHQHCPAGYEIYNGKPIYYGTGNFFAPRQNKSLFDDGWNYGYVVRLCIEKGTLDADIIPYYFSDDGDVFRKIDIVKFGNFLKTISEPIGNYNELNNCWNCWSTLVGPMHYKSLEKAITQNNSKENECRVLSCLMTESIHELLTNYVRLKFLDKLVIDVHYKELLEKTINMEEMSSDRMGKHNYNSAIMLWGVSDSMFDRLNDCFEKNNDSELIIIDSDKKKQGFQCGGVRIMSPLEGVKKFKMFKKGVCYVCTPKKFYSEIVDYLNCNGIFDEQIVF